MPEIVYCLNEQILEEEVYRATTEIKDTFLCFKPRRTRGQTKEDIKDRRFKKSLNSEK